jgi:hypothetical protein
MSAKSSYRHASQDIEMLTGAKVSFKPQQQLVHRQEFEAPEVVAEDGVSELSLDGGNIRLLAPKGQASPWRQYKALRVNGDGVGIATYQTTQLLNQWSASLAYAESVYCLGDGHLGIWGTYEQMSLPKGHEQILDGYHLKENLYKVGGSLKRLKEAEFLLWQGKVAETMALFEPMQKAQAHRFCEYLRTHKSRIVNYQYYQAEDIPIGSGSVEFWVKLIDQRTQVVGARWKEAHVPQVLAHRCAYLNGQLDSPISLS